MVAMQDEIARFIAGLAPEQAARLHVFPLGRTSGPTDLAISYRKEKRLSPVEHAFIQCAQAFFRPSSSDRDTIQANA